MTSAMRLQADGPVHVSLNISCRHRGHHIAAKQKAHLPLVSAGFALRLGSALDGATKPLLLIALHERSVLCLTCSDARSVFLQFPLATGMMFITSCRRSRQSCQESRQNHAKCTFVHAVT